MSEQGPLAGISVVELASWMMTPASGSILASFGADVIKIEPAGSADPIRRLNEVGVGGGTLEPSFELANNGKRSIQLDVRSEAGREVMQRLLEHADIFLTNVRAKALERAGLGLEALHQRYPRLIVAHGSSYGRVGPVAHHPSFDELAYWSRGGMATALQDEGTLPVAINGAMGDLPTAVTLAAGMLLALYRREREGVGAIVDVSLYQCGIWANGTVLAAALAGVQFRPRRGRHHPFNPLDTSYQCADGAWVQFAMLQPTRYWRPLCEALERPDLADDPRFDTMEHLFEHVPEATAELEQAIAVFTREELGRRLESRDLPWAPLFDAEDIVSDEQARVNNYFVKKQHRSGVEMETLAPPFGLRDEAPQMEPAPEAGQHSEEVLLELGYSWDEIGDLRERGAF